MAEKSLCALVGQSSRLMNRSSANQTVVQTGTKCFSHEDINPQWWQFGSAIKLLKDKSPFWSPLRCWVSQLLQLNMELEGKQVP